MKKEWIAQLVVLTIMYLNSIFYVEHEGIFFADTPLINLVFLAYTAILLVIVNYVLIPKLFYAKRYLLFFISLIILIALFGIIEEGIVEKILSPNNRGGDLTWQGVYWYFGEILIPLLTFMTIKFVFDNFAQEQKLERIEKDSLSNELKLLKSQMQPHILFNSLNNLYHFALKKSDEVPELILKLSNVLRYVLYEATEDRVDLNKELVFIKDYIDLQEIQYKGRGKIQCDIQDITNNESLKVAPFLLIPFIENSFKHSFGTKIKNVLVEIIIKIEQQELQLFVKNNYENNGGKSKELIQGGIGLMNVKKRLQLLYPNKFNIRITEGNEEYIVNLSIELS